MERLLTWDEMQDAHHLSVGSGVSHDTAIAAAQLAKTDAEWVESMPIMWDKCWTKTCIYMTPDCDFLGNACMAWQSRRKEIGL